LKGKQTSEKKEPPRPGKYYCYDNSGMLHLGDTREEAELKAAESNRELNIKIHVNE